MENERRPLLVGESPNVVLAQFCSAHFEGKVQRVFLNVSKGQRRATTRGKRGGTSRGKKGGKKKGKRNPEIWRKRKGIVIMKWEKDGRG